MGEVNFGFAMICEKGYLTNVYFPSKLGGKPAWLHLGAFPSTEELKCAKCNEQKSFLCQIYAPFNDEYNFHRIIYIFICRTESCYIANDNGNITVFRSQLPKKNEFYPDIPPPEEDVIEPEIIPKEHKLCTVCGCLAPFKCSRCKKVQYCGRQHQRLHWPNHKVSCSQEQASAHVNDEEIAHLLFPEWEIDITVFNDDEENDLKTPIDEDQELQKLQNMVASAEAGSLQNIPEIDFEQYAQNGAEIDDKYFDKFRKECETFTHQIIRYKLNGEVLWITDPKKLNDQLKNIPKCELCGEQRTFEFQIMPQMLVYLEDTRIDWGIIAIYTCSKSCPLPKEKGYVHEYCIKQDVDN